MNVGIRLPKEHLLNVIDSQTEFEIHPMTQQILQYPNLCRYNGFPFPVDNPHLQYRLLMEGAIKM
jgi:hypothetical protein